VNCARERKEDKNTINGKVRGEGGTRLRATGKKKKNRFTRASSAKKKKNVKAEGGGSETLRQCRHLDGNHLQEIDCLP